MILAARSLDKAKTAIEQLSSSNVHPLELDVSDDRSIERAIKGLNQDDAAIWLATDADTQISGRLFHD